MLSEFEFQSTHPRGVRRKLVVSSIIVPSISIHAPAWGATPELAFFRSTENISIHAPAWGATISPSVARSLRYSFQSTHPRGVRLHTLFQSCHTDQISIHAPAWGATSSTFAKLYFGVYFNPRTRVGCDHTGDVVIDSAVRFQSTHPRGVRRREIEQTSGPLFISIHAPAWGATGPQVVLIWQYLISIHAPAWGATIHVLGASFRIDISIHAPAWGATRSQTA